MSQLCFEGPEDKLRRDEFTQPAIVTVSVAAERVLRAQGIVPLSAAIRTYRGSEHSVILIEGMRYAYHYRAEHSSQHRNDRFWNNEIIKEDE